MANSFDKEMGKHQIAWRRKYLDYSEQGRQNRVSRPWLLPRDRWEDGLWPGIRSGSSNSLPAYLKEASVQKHDGVHNLKSSWMLCANLYFPFREDRDLLAGFLAAQLSPLIATVDEIELEYEEPPPFDPPSVLGEPGGTKGSNQTSPDVAFVVSTVNGGKGLILTENKLTEHSFYQCSGRDKKYGNPDPSRCLDFGQLYSNLSSECYQLNWEADRRPNRRYWDHIRISEEGRRTLRRCPAATGGYQLFRQQALSEAIAKSGRYEFVMSCVAYDERNKDLIECLRMTGIEDFRTDWACLFEGETRFGSFSHQQWVAWVGKNDSQERWRDWFSYVKERYGC